MKIFRIEVWKPRTRVKIRIDRSHVQQLLRGEPVGIKVPQGTQIVELSFEPVAKPVHKYDGTDSFAKICDVFFNGRPA